ncbi:MAG: hypothetical protein GX372_08720 [Ignavibacteria bacterium]|jgi:dihydroorotate dehydrogenase|nr:hypothetical protein [Ignavibacteria bacterium]
MKLVEAIAFYEGKLRKHINILPPWFVSFIYSNSRNFFIRQLISTNFDKKSLPEEYRIKIWDLEFNCPLFNAAGMFKDGEGYSLCAKMGAGAFLAGTTTFNARLGNKKKCIKHPFMPYANSLSSSNWMGLPNLSHALVAKKISQIEKIKYCNIGASVAADPEADNAVDGILTGLSMYEEAGVDFIELNESCPNVPHHSSEIESNCNQVPQNLIDRLEIISKNFIKKQKKHIPVIVKFSNDTQLIQIEALIDVLIDLDFDGVNFGNTSINYEHYLKKIDPKDVKLFNYFTQNFGGGLSGDLLKENSLELCKEATNYINKKTLHKEFHCIRTGGINDKKDILISQENGILLNEWFAGFFENFAKYGFNIYQEFFN